jgi:hypothetical protein
MAYKNAQETFEGHRKRFRRSQMRHRVTVLAIALNGVLFATAQAQSPATSGVLAENPAGNPTIAPPDGSTQRDFKLMMPDGSGGLKELPDLSNLSDATTIGPDSSVGSVLVAPTDPQILPPKEDDSSPGPEH